MSIVRDENLGPKFGLTTLNQVASLLLEHRVLVGDSDEFIVAEALGVCDIRKVRISGLAEFTNNKRLVQLFRSVSVNNLTLVERTYVILFEELLGVVVTVDIDFGESVKDSRVLAARLHTSFEPRHNEFETVPGLDLLHKFVDGKVSRDRRQQGFDTSLIAVNIQ